MKWTGRILGHTPTDCRLKKTVDDMWSNNLDILSRWCYLRAGSASSWANKTSTCSLVDHLKLRCWLEAYQSLPFPLTHLYQSGPSYIKIVSHSCCCFFFFVFCFLKPWRIHCQACPGWSAVLKEITPTAERLKITLFDTDALSSH